MEKVYGKVSSLLRYTNECINYPIINSEGYGLIQRRINGVKKHFLAHRISYMLVTDKNIPPSVLVCHKCDNPACVDPRHLFEGSHQDNMADKVSKTDKLKAPKTADI